MSDQTYNGWTNYETWVIKLWLDNEEGTYQLQREWVQEAREEAGARNLTATLADRIKDWVEENNPITDASMYSDLLSAAISEAGFYEMAEALEAEYPPEDEDEEDEDEDEEEEEE